MAQTAYIWPTDFTTAHSASSGFAQHASAAVEGSLGLRNTIGTTNQVGLAMPKVGAFAANVADAMVAVAMKTAGGNDGARLTLRHPVGAGTPADGLAAGDLSATTYMAQIDTSNLYLLRGSYSATSPTILATLGIGSVPTVGTNNLYQFRIAVRTIGASVFLVAYYASTATPQIATDAAWTLLGSYEDTSASRITAAGGFGFGGRKGSTGSGVLDFDYFQVVVLS